MPLLQEAWALEKNCYSWKRKKEEVAAEENTAGIAQDVETAQALNVADFDITECWIMDSGCSFHMCPKIEWFNNMRQCIGSVFLGNNQVCKVEGMEDIKLRMKDGSLMILTEVRYIPDIKRNLIFLGALERKGYSFLSVDGLMKVMKGSEVVMEAKRRYSLYYLKAIVVIDQVNMVKKIDLETWHLRLGHVSKDGKNQLIKGGIIEADSRMVSRDCEVCVLGKSKKLVYPTGKHTSSSTLDYAHSDIWGPAQTMSVGGGMYFLSIVDDYSRKIWLYIMKEKSEAFSKFREWCTEVKVEKSSTLKCLRTNNGLEFLSHEFDDYCKLKGIKRHRTVPNNPQQNEWWRGQIELS